MLQIEVIGSRIVLNLENIDVKYPGNCHDITILYSRCGGGGLVTFLYKIKTGKINLIDFFINRAGFLCKKCTLQRTLFDMKPIKILLFFFIL